MFFASLEFPRTESEAVLPGQGCEWYWQHIARCRELQMVGEVLPPPVGSDLVLHTVCAKNSDTRVGWTGRPTIHVTEREPSQGRAGLPLGMWRFTANNKQAFDAWVPAVCLPSKTHQLRKMANLNTQGNPVSFH